MKNDLSPFFIFIEEIHLTEGREKKKKKRKSTILNCNLDCLLAQTLRKLYSLFQ